MSKDFLKFWGVRGSYFTSDPRMKNVGGNTTCFEMKIGKAHIILDAGSGIVPLGDSLKGSCVDALLLFTHIHLDHITGLPYFQPVFSPQNSITINLHNKRALKTSLKHAFTGPLFPFGFERMRAVKNIFLRDSFTYKGIKIDCHPMNHPNMTVGWRFIFGGKKIILISDNEPLRDLKKHARFVEWIKGADVMVHDSQYTPEEFAQRIGWGHSPYPYPLELAAAGGVKQIYLHHHNLYRTDKEVLRIVAHCRTISKKFGFGVKCDAAREGMVVNI